MPGCLASGEGSSGFAGARVRALAVSGAILLLALAAPATPLAAEPAPNGPAAPVDAEQPNPTSSPADPPPADPPPADPVDGAPQSDQGEAPAAAGQEGRARSRGARAAAPRPEVAARSAARADSVSIVGDTFSAFAFSPKSITVQVGDTVRWHNESSASEGHTVTGDGLDSGTFHQGDDYAFKFSHAGTFSYICALHPSMKGKVTVSGGGGGSGGRGSGGGGGNSSGSGGGGGDSSGSGSGAGGTPSGSVGASPGSDPGGSGQLPVTGLALVPLGAIGVGLLIAGMLLRRRAELYY
jgi:plastocyanin